MSYNPYQPPNTEIYDVSFVDPSLMSAEGRPYFVTSIKKLVVLSIMSFGLYSIYWFYKHWSAYKKVEGQNIWPIPRAVFSIFFIHRLFDDMNQRALSKDLESDNNLNEWASFFVFILIASRVSDKIFNDDISIIISFVVSVIIALPMVYAQRVANRVCGDPLGKSNSRFGLANYLLILIGSSWWVLALFGLFVILFS